MIIELKKTNYDDLELFYNMQIESFKSLLEKYQDYNTNPGNEPFERIIERFNQSFTDYYIIMGNNKPAGGIRIIHRENDRYRVSLIFILPEYQGRGIAQQTFNIIEQIYQDAKVWELDTVLEEEGHCYLYEKLGYVKTGKLEKITDLMTIVDYEKIIKK